VLVTQRLPNDELYRELRETVDERPQDSLSFLYRIGDALAPRLILDAVFDGHRLGREIDDESAAEPAR
jgi:dimethylamine/trimethylamine dehydrogenase